MPRYYEGRAIKLEKCNMTFSEAHIRDIAQFLDLSENYKKQYLNMFLDFDESIFGNSYIRVDNIQESTHVIADYSKISAQNILDLIECSEELAKVTKSKMIEFNLLDPNSELVQIISDNNYEMTRKIIGREWNKFEKTVSGPPNEDVKYQVKSALITHLLTSRVSEEERKVIKYYLDLIG